MSFFLIKYEVSGVDHSGLKANKLHAIVSAQFIDCRCEI